MSADDKKYDEEKLFRKLSEIKALPWSECAELSEFPEVLQLTLYSIWTSSEKLQFRDLKKMTGMSHAQLDLQSKRLASLGYIKKKASHFLEDTANDYEDIGLTLDGLEFCEKVFKR